MGNLDEFNNAAQQVKNTASNVNQTKDAVNNAKGGKLPNEIERENDLNKLRTAALPALGVLKANNAQLVAFLNANKSVVYPSYYANAIAIWRLVYRANQSGMSPVGRELVNVDTRNAINTVLNWLIAEPTSGGIPGILNMNLYATRAGDEPVPGSAEGSELNPDGTPKTPAGESNLLLWVLGGLGFLGLIAALLFRGKKSTGTAGLEGADKIVTLNLL